MPFVITGSTLPLTLAGNSASCLLTAEADSANEVDLQLKTALGMCQASHITYEMFRKLLCLSYSYADGPCEWLLFTC